MSSAKQLDQKNIKKSLNEVGADRVSIHFIDRPNDSKDYDVIVLGHCEEDENVAKIVQIDRVNHFCQEESFTKDHERILVEKIIESSDSFFSGPMTFLNSCVELGIKPVYQTSITGSDSKRQLIDDLDNILNKIKGTRTVSDSVKSIADELVSNSIYNAPFLGQEIDRKSTILLDSDQQGNFFLGSGDSWLVIGVEDPFGTLDPDSIVKKIVESYKSGIDSIMNMGRGGAGIGLRMVFDYCSSLYMAVKKNEKTVVFGILPLGKSRKKVQLNPKGLHIFKMD